MYQMINNRSFYVEFNSFELSNLIDINATKESSPQSYSRFITFLQDLSFQFDAL